MKELREAHQFTHRLRIREARFRRIISKLRHRFVSVHLHPTFLDISGTTRRELLFPKIQKNGSTRVVLDCGHATLPTRPDIVKHLTQCAAARQASGIAFKNPEAQCSVAPIEQKMEELRDVGVSI